jgi:hypothetical protein
MRCLQEYPLDESLMALNAADQYHQRSLVQKPLPMAADKGGDLSRLATTAGGKGVPIFGCDIRGDTTKKTD